MDIDIQIQTVSFVEFYDIIVKVEFRVGVDDSGVPRLEGRLGRYGSASRRCP